MKRAGGGRKRFAVVDRLPSNEPTKTSGSALANMPLDQLHKRCVAGAKRIDGHLQTAYRKIKPDLKYIAEMRERFAEQPRGNANIKGCKTWGEYVRKFLNRSESTIRELLAEVRTFDDDDKPIYTTPTVAESVRDALSDSAHRIEPADNVMRFGVPVLATDNDDQDSEPVARPAEAEMVNISFESVNMEEPKPITVTYQFIDPTECGEMQKGKIVFENCFMDKESLECEDGYVRICRPGGFQIDLLIPKNEYPMGTLFEVTITYKPHAKE